MLKYSKIRKVLDIENMNGNAEDLAFFTHYLHNHTNGVSKSFKKRAVSCLCARKHSEKIVNKNIETDQPKQQTLLTCTVK